MAITGASQGGLLVGVAITKRPDLFKNMTLLNEMAIRSHLLEHVAKRIINKILKESKMVTNVKVAVSKINPPIGGDVEMVTIEMEEYRS